MGVSTDAILAFGFDLGDAEDMSLAERFGAAERDEDEEDFDFDDWIARQAGAIYPAGHSGIDSPEYRAYSEKRDAAIAACPVEVITHCSYDYPMHFLALRGTERKAWRGHPVKVETPAPDASRLAAMRAFCEQHGIEWQEPAWHIFSLWG
jgi:hypothetical protein